MLSKLITGRRGLQASWESKKMYDFDDKYVENVDGLWGEEACIEAACRYVIFRAVANAAVRAGVIDTATIVDFVRNQIKADEMVPELFELVPEPFLVFTDSQIRFTSGEVWNPVMAFAEERKGRVEPEGFTDKDIAKFFSA